MKLAGKRKGGLARGRLAGLLGAAVTLVAGGLYLSTLAPTVLYQDYPEMHDAAMLQVTAAVLGTAHPTGYPTYTMLGKLFTYLPMGDIAYRVNLLSAVAGALAVLFTYLAGLKLSGRAVAAAAGALAFGLAPVFWSQAVIAEVYTLNAAFISAELWLLLSWRERRQNAYLLAFAFVSGLALTHHITSALLLPVALLFVFVVERRKLAEARLVLRGAGLFVVGLLPYLYLPVRAAMEPPLNEGDPSTLGRFLLLITGGGYVQKQMAGGGSGSGNGAGLVQLAADALGRISERLSGEYFLGQFPSALVVVGVIGLFYLLFRDRAAAVLVGIPFAGWSAHGLLYTFVDFYIFFIPAYLAFALLVAAGAGLLLRGARDLAGRLAEGPASQAALVAVPSVLLLAIPLLGAPDTYRAVDRSEDYRGRKIIETVAREAEPGATVLHHRSNLWYMVLVEQRRRDLTLVDPFSTAWLRHTDMVWPAPVNRKEAAARYGTDDESGVEAARKAARRGPVYLLRQEGLDTGSFEKAGFEVVPAGKKGILYELIPEEQADQ